MSSTTTVDTLTKLPPNPQSIVLPITNLKKRKLDEYENEPNSKRRKLNDNHTNHEFNPLIEENTLLKNKNYELEQKNNQITKQNVYYKQQMEQWKLKYNTLYSQLCILTKEINNDLGINNAPMQQPIKPIPNTHTNHAPIKPIEMINSDDHSIESENMIHKHNPNESKFEDSYYVSVNCHICEEGFNDINKYRDHIKEHYNNNKNKTWLACDLGCKLICKQDMHFIRHIATHTNDKPFICKMEINGTKCGVGKGYKSDLKRHWKSHFKSNDNEVVNDSKYDIIKQRLIEMGFNKKDIMNKICECNGTNISPEFIFNQIANNNNQIINNKQSDNVTTNFENSYMIAIDCHICKKHFNNMTIYKQHLKQHYHNDNNREWLVCDFGCGNKSVDAMKFVSHIALHMNNKPFKCKLCNQSMGYKLEMRNHWKKSHEIKKQKGKIKSENKNNKTDKKERTIEFENSYIFSVKCHICKKHFNNYNKYEKHIKNHYDSNNKTIWRQCDFGCKIDPNKPLFKDNAYFISHISQHTKDKPFKCQVIINGIKCQSACGSKHNMKIHWRSHYINQKMRYNKRKKKSAKKPKQKRKSKNGINNKMANNICHLRNIDFNSSYYISINCHICGKYFSDYYEYKNHLRDHYVSNPSKTWLKCDFSCTNASFPHYSGFICHIHSHLKTFPFKCNVIMNSIKCDGVAAQKSDMKKHWKNKHYCNDYVEFEKSYYISVHCHLCKKHFKNIKKYKNHIKKHYDNNPNREWLKCDFDCQRDPKKPLFANWIDFISHLGQHTNDKPYKCHIVTNGNKCKQSCGNKYNLKRHWQTHFKQIGQINDINDNNITEFDDSYFISINCHLCQEHFDNLHEYRDHLKDHYDTDPLREWLKCEFGCKDASYTTYINFISHIASHTKKYPFKCKVIKMGCKCMSTAGTKSNMKQHWMRNHCKDNKQNKNKNKTNINNTLKIKVKKENNNSNNNNNSEESCSSCEESEWESESYSESDGQLEIKKEICNNDKNDSVSFENSYYFSIDCHVCNKHFDNVSEYRSHLKEHYDNDTNKQWLFCDFGCENQLSPHYQGFLRHIASHTKQYPFHCSIVVNGNTCERTAGQIGDMRKHWNAIHDNNNSTNNRSEVSDNESDNSSSDSDYESDNSSISHSTSESEINEKNSEIQLKQEQIQLL